MDREISFTPSTDAEAAEFTNRAFRPQRWQDQPALVAKDGGSMRPYYEGEQFNPEIWDFDPEGWDHEHCSICGAHICSEPGCGFSEAYINEEEAWFCPHVTNTPSAPLARRRMHQSVDGRFPDDDTTQRGQHGHSRCVRHPAHGAP